MTNLPNELLMHIIHLTERQDLREYLFVCKYTWQLVRQRVYRKVIFPDTNIQEQDLISFCELYGQSIETMKLPQARYFPDTVYEQILQLCPNLDYLQSSIYPKQIKQLQNQSRPSICYMTTEIPVDLLLVGEGEGQEEEEEEEEEEIYHTDYQTITYFPCCPSFFIFPSESSLHNNKEEEEKALTQISHYFHHPGALSNAILPTFGSDLLALTLNPYDVLTASVARLIVSKCPRLRYLVVPSVKAEGLWMLLRWCQTLATVIVGDDDENNLFDEEEEEEEEEEEQDEVFFFQRRARAVEEGQDMSAITTATTGNNTRYYTELENERAVETIKHHKRVWCVHSSQTITNRTLWHIGIVPKV